MPSRVMLRVVNDSRGPTSARVNHYARRCWLVAKRRRAGSDWQQRSEILAKFVLLVKIGDQAARDAARPKHREYLTQLFADGKLIEAGPFKDGKGSLFIYEAADEAEARAIFAADP